MANRSYLYSVGNRPSSYADRPETISGLSQWAYDVPFSYRLLMSGDTKVCSSLISDGFDEEPSNKKTKLFAISANFEQGFSRLRRFFSVIRPLAACTAPEFITWLDETVEFLEAHRDRYLLLETIELDLMSAEETAALRNCVDNEMIRCQHVGVAVDALPEDVTEAGKCLTEALRRKCETPFDALYGLRLDNDCDNVRDEKTKYPLGLEWTTALYFSLWNRVEFEANS